MTASALSPYSYRFEELLALPSPTPPPPAFPFLQPTRQDIHRKTDLLIREWGMVNARMFT